MGIRRATSAAALVILLLVAGLMTSCEPSPRAEPAQGPIGGTPVNIELLGFAGCPNTPKMRQNLSAALAEIGDQRLRLTEIHQDALPEADLRRGYPTPTVLVNGDDLYDMPPPTSPAMGCRMYPGGVPTADELAGRIRMKTAP